MKYVLFSFSSLWKKEILYILFYRHSKHPHDILDLHPISLFIKDRSCLFLLQFFIFLKKCNYLWAWRTHADMRHAINRHGIFRNRYPDFLHILPTLPKTHICLLDGNGGIHDVIKIDGKYGASYACYFTNRCMEYYAFRIKSQKAFEKFEKVVIFLRFWEISGAAFLWKSDMRADCF